MNSAANPRDELVARYLGLAPGRNEDQVLRLVVETGVRSVGADEGSLLVHDPDSQELTFVMVYPTAGESMLVGQRVPLGQGITGLAAATGEVQIGAPKYHDIEQTDAMVGIQSVIAAPMLLEDRLIGVITAVATRSDKRFTASDGELYACLSTIAALVVDQALKLRSQLGGVREPVPVAMAPDPDERDVLDRVYRLLQRDPGTVRQLARLLEAVEAMSPGTDKA